MQKCLPLSIYRWASGCLGVWAVAAALGCNGPSTSASRPSGGSATAGGSGGSGGSGHFGAALSAASALSAAVVLAEPKKYDDKDIKLQGQISGVCQNKGCWMTLGTGEPGQSTVRVTFKDYGFFVPKDCMGKNAVVEGRFKVTMLSVAQAQHYADDAAKAGAPAQQITAPQPTLALVATGVDLL